MTTTKNHFRSVTTLMVALTLGVILLCPCSESLAQIPDYWGLQPIPVNPIVNELDGQATFNGEWNQANWAPDILPQQGTMYGEIIANWLATASNPPNQFSYSGNTLLLMHDISDLISQDLWDYNTFEIAVNGNKVTGWVLANGNHPDNLDYQWIGGSGIGYSTIDDRGYLVRLNDDMTTDLHWYPGGFEPGDPGFNWNNWHGFFGSYGFNNSCWVQGLPNSTNGANEVYEVAFREYGASPLRTSLPPCTVIIMIICDPKSDGSGGWYNVVRKIIIVHVKPPPPPPPPIIIIVIPVQIVNVPFNAGPIVLPVVLHNEYTTTQSGVALLTSSHGFVIVPPTIPYTLAPGQTATYQVTLNIPPDPNLIGQVDTIRASTTEYTSYRILHITDVPHLLTITPETVTIPVGTTLAFSCAATDLYGKLLDAGTPTWSMTGIGGYFTSIAEEHVPAAVDMIQFTATSEGSGYVEALGSSGLIGRATVNVISPSSLNVTMMPINPPIIIPANGGSFNFNASVIRTIGPAAPFTVWARIKNPNGTYTPPTVGPVQINPPVGLTVMRQRTQNVPGTWAPGTYHTIGYANITVSYPAMDADSFMWTKSATADGGPFVWEASCTGELFPGEVLNNSVSTTPELLRSSPNPFNPSTAISFKLPTASKVSLKVYDASGRLVATLVDGWREAGSHEMTFDGSSYATGVYLLRLSVRDYTAVQKMVLMK